MILHPFIRLPSLSFSLYLSLSLSLFFCPTRPAPPARHQYHQLCETNTLQQQQRDLEAAQNAQERAAKEAATAERHATVVAVLEGERNEQVRVWYIPAFLLHQNGMSIRYCCTAYTCDILFIYICAFGLGKHQQTSCDTVGRNQQ
jgi:hypothetical protein